MKKTITFILSVIMLFSVAACSATEDKGQDTTEEKDNTEINFDSTEFTINYYHLNYGENSIFTYRNNTAYADKARQRLSDIEAAYNCSIEVEDNYYLDRNMVEIISGMVASGTEGYDISAIEGNESISNFIRNDLLVPLSEYRDIIDYENQELYGSAGSLEVAMLDGEVYMVNAAMHPMRQLTPGILIVFNEELTDMYAPGIDFRALNEQKQWTWDTFTGFLDGFTADDSDKKIYAFAGTREMTYLAMISNGYTLAVSDGNGGWKSGVNEPNVTEAIDWLRNLYIDYKDKICDLMYFGETLQKLTDGDTLLSVIMPEDIIASVSYNVERFGVLPFPYGPSCEYGKAVNCSGLNGLGINTTTVDEEASARIIEAYCRPFEEYKTTEELYALYDDVFFDKRDIAVITNMGKYARSPYYPYGGLDFTYSVQAALSRKSTAELIATYAPQAEAVVEEFIAPNMDYVTSH